jgi:hypothetical protein
MKGGFLHMRHIIARKRIPSTHGSLLVRDHCPVEEVSKENVCSNLKSGEQQGIGDKGNYMSSGKKQRKTMKPCGEELL